MPDHTSKEKIDRILRSKFGVSLAPPTLAPRGGGSGYNFELMGKVDAYRDELKAKSPSELDEIYAAAVAAQRDREALQAKLEEESRYFNRPSANADFDYWAKVEYWSMDESVALLLGKAPEVVNWKGVQPYVNVSDFAWQYERLRNLAQRAQAMNRGEYAVYPSTVLEWAAGMDIQIPAGLQAAIDARQAKLRALARRQPESVGEVAAPADARNPEALRAPTDESGANHSQDAPNQCAPGTTAESTRHHSTKERRDSLWPVIEHAQRECSDQNDAAEVWARLQVLAEKKMPPLIGCEEEGLQYLHQGAVSVLSRNALALRLKRAAAKRR